MENKAGKVPTPDGYIHIYLKSREFTLFPTPEKVGQALGRMEMDTLGIRRPLSEIILDVATVFASSHLRRGSQPQLQTP